LTDSPGLVHSFDPITKIWKLLSSAEDSGRPTDDLSNGFTSAGGKLFVHLGHHVDIGE
jgi:hypothetical protein